jgi:hypothetical protein
MFRNAPCTAMAPSFTAPSDARLPPKLPMGVRVAETMYTSFISFDDLGDLIIW